MGQGGVRGGDCCGEWSPQTCFREPEGSAAAIVPSNKGPLPLLAFQEGMFLDMRKAISKIQKSWRRNRSTKHAMPYVD